MTAEGAIVRVKARHRRRWGRWVASAILIVLLALVVRLFAQSPNMRWDVVGTFMFDPGVLQGVVTTIQLTVLGQLFAILIGLVIALLQQSRNPISATVAAVYVWYFRGVPLVVQLLFFYNIALLIPSIGFAIPFTDIAWNADTNDVISGFTAAIIGLALHEAAYMAEIVRGGILSVPRGQMDAALSIGLQPGQAMRRIVLPQTLRVIVPPTGNQFIGLLKASSLVSVIGGGDLLTQVEYIYGRNFLVIPLLIVASIWYLILVTIASVVLYVLESRLDPDRTDGGGVGMLRRIGWHLAPVLRRSGVEEP